ncbi:hypothetical protein HMPREF1589_03180 [Escherichia coli 113290]|nr:hypothetical protein HMPREF1589_03180 [Escherichia coli 113290]
MFLNARICGRFAFWRALLPDQRKRLIWPTVCVRNQNPQPIQYLTPSYFPSLV